MEQQNIYENWIVEFYTALKMSTMFNDFLGNIHYKFSYFCLTSMLININNVLNSFVKNYNYLRVSNIKFFKNLKSDINVKFVNLSRISIVIFMV